MTHDISHADSATWAARTASGMIFVSLGLGELDAIAGGVLVAVRNDGGEVVAARLIGLVAGDAPEPGRWKIEGRYRVDASGEPIGQGAAATEVAVEPVQGHDWGALGLPDGVASRVRPRVDARGLDEVTLAHSSSGHRILEGNPLLTLMPGHSVAIDGSIGTVVFIDRRKRTVEIERDGDMTVHDFDDVQIRETT